MMEKARRYLRYIKVCFLVIRYRLRYKPTGNIKYLFLSWHRDMNLPMYLTMDFHKTESMGDEVWADLFFPVFDRKKNAYDDYLSEHVTEISRHLDPTRYKTIQQRLFYFIVFGHVTRMLKGKTFIIVNQRNRQYINLLAPYLERKSPDTVMIIQYIDTVSLDKISDIEEYKKIKNAEIYTFDRKDAEQFGLKYYHWYVDDKRLLGYSKIKPSFDLSFVGEDKGKVREIKRLEKILNQQGISYSWHVIFSDEFEKSIGVKKDKTFHYKNEYLSTFDYQKKLCEAKVILELLQDGQFGPTLDLANSIFLRRKLVTNNTDVVNEDCYDPRNIFILGVDDIKGLKKFVESPYKVLPKKVTDKYTYEYMLKELG